MRDVRKIIGGVLQRLPGESDQDWSAAQAAHVLTTIAGRRFVLHYELRSLVSEVTLVDLDADPTAALSEIIEFAERVVAAARHVSRPKLGVKIDDIERTIEALKAI